MKFQCDRCKTRYSIADEKVRGKVLKIRCKNCSSIITVREGAAEATPAPEDLRKPAVVLGGPARQNGAARPAGTPAPSAPALQGAFQRAMVKMPAAAIPDYADDEEMPGEKTTIGETPIPTPPEDEWYLSVDGSQDGPFTLAQAQRKCADKAPGIEMFSWRDGFDDWLPVEKIPELAPHVRPRPVKRVVAPPIPQDVKRPLAAAPAPAPSTRSAPAAVGAGGLAAHTSTPARAVTPLPVKEKDGSLSLSDLAAQSTQLANGTGQNERSNATPDPAEFDFNVSEASQMVQLSKLARAQQNGGQTGTVTRLTPPNGNAAVGRGTGGNTALQTAAAANLTGAAAVLTPVAPPRRRSSLLPLVIGLGILAAGIIGVIVFMSVRQNHGTTAEEELAAQESGGGNPVIDEFYKTGGLPGSNVPQGQKTNAGNSGGNPDKNPVKPISRPVVKGNNTSTQTRPVQPAGGKIDDFTGGDEPMGELTPDDVIEKGRTANPAMKQCYNHALKDDPTLRLKRMDVRITVAASGMVSDVRMTSNSTASPTLTSCLTNLIKRWKFHKSNEGLTADLPIIFSNG